jgi:serine/threonine protein kinase
VHPFGSPGYCAPERLARSQVDQQSDLWAVGATLYEMLSGSPLYRAQNTRQLESLIRSRRPPRALPDSVPKALRLVVTKTLAPDASKRYRSAVEMMADLHAFLIHKPTLAEMERSSLWNPTATLEMARTMLRRATRKVRGNRAGWPMAQALLWFGLGMAMSVGVSVWIRAASAYPPPIELPKPKVPGAPIVEKIVPAPPAEEAAPPVDSSAPVRVTSPPARRAHLRKWYARRRR